jgi:hypothetical protein
MKEDFIPSFGQRSFREFKQHLPYGMDARLSVLAINAGEELSINHNKQAKKLNK